MVWVMPKYIEDSKDTLLFVLMTQDIVFTLLHSQNSPGAR